LKSVPGHDLQIQNDRCLKQHDTFQVNRTQP
jgi:hypothetical protein